MSLVDIDHHADDRAHPLPNAHDKINPSMVQAKGTNSVNYTTPASNTSTLEAGKNGQFTIVQVGDFITTEPIVTVSPGANNYGDSGFLLYQQPHNLDFTPSIISYEETSAGQYSAMPIVGYSAPSSSQALWYEFFCFVDDTYVYIGLNALQFGDFTVTFNAGFIFKWYLLYQTSN